jgi:hypothetical protein
MNEIIPLGNTRSILLLSLLIILFAACSPSSHRAIVVEPFQTQKLADFSTLEIPYLKTTLSDELDQEILQEIPTELIKKLTEERLYKRITRKTNDTEGVLLMEGTVISYEKGNRAKRYILGEGAGKAFCTVQFIFKSKATGQMIAKINFEGELSQGFFLGGSSEGATRAVVSAIVAYFKQNY